VRIPLGGRTSRLADPSDLQERDDGHRERIGRGAEGEGGREGKGARERSCAAAREEGEGWGEEEEREKKGRGEEERVLYRQKMCLPK